MLSEAEIQSRLKEVEAKIERPEGWWANQLDELEDLRTERRVLSWVLERATP